MEQLTKRLTDTATILGNIPRMIDLADERELAILAALVKGYGECEEVKRIWQAVDQYLEGIALAALATEGGAITKDVVCTRRVGVLEDAVRYVRSGEAPEGGEALHGERADDYALLRDALWFATYGEPETPRLKLSGGDRKPCTMRRAFELAVTEADAEAREKEAQRKAEEADSERDKAPAAMTPAERKQALAENRQSRKAVAASVQGEGKLLGEIDAEARELRRLIKRDKARKAKPKRKPAPTPIDSKRKAARKGSRKAARKAA